MVLRIYRVFQLNNLKNRIMTKKFAEKVLQYLGLKIANRMANDLEIAKFYALNDMISSGEIK